MPVQYLMLKHHYELEVCFNDLNKPPLFHDLTRSFSIYIYTHSPDVLSPQSVHHKCWARGEDGEIKI